MKSTRFGEAEYASCYSMEGQEERELQCPLCDCPKILFNPDTVTGGHLYLGEEVTCYECGHKFTITENCWKLVKIWE